MATTSLVVVNESVRFPKVKLADPAPSEYVRIAAEVDERQNLTVLVSCQRLFSTRSLVRDLERVGKDL